MPRSRSRPKKNSKAPRTKARKNFSNKAPRPSVFNDSKLDYDTSETQFENYKRLGLLADANQIGKERDRIVGFKPRVKGPSAEPSAAASAACHERPGLGCVSCVAAPAAVLRAEDGA